MTVLQKVKKRVGAIAGRVRAAWLFFKVSRTRLSVMPVILPSYFRGFLLKKSIAQWLLVILGVLVGFLRNTGIYDQF